MSNVSGVLRASKTAGSGLRRKAQLFVLGMAVVLLLAATMPVEAQIKEKFGVGIVPFLNGGDDVEKAMHSTVGQFPEIDRMYNPASPAELFKILANLKKMGRKVDFLVIAGHGSKGAPRIDFAGDSLEPKDVALPDMREQLAALQNNLKNAKGNTSNLQLRIAGLKSKISTLESTSDVMNRDAAVVLINCSTAASPEGRTFVRNMGDVLLSKRGGVIVSSETDVELGQVRSLANKLRAWWKTGDWVRIGDFFVTGDWVSHRVSASKPDDDKADPNSIAGWWLWVRSGQDAKKRATRDLVPVYLNKRGDDGMYRGVYFPYLTMTTLRMTPHLSPSKIAFKKSSGNTYHYTWQYPNGPKGTGTMTMQGSRMSGNWAETDSNGSGTWTWSRPSASDKAKLVKHFGRPDVR